MSYSGFSQFLCKNGHYWEMDCMTLPNLMYEEDVKQKCPVCNEEEVWENMVNITNGSWDDDETRIDGYVELKLKIKRSGVCSACGEEHVCEKRYLIPKKKIKKEVGKK
ncbi:hypothetical protein LCGC14_0556570 [marine sediment metagenome]|uniref:Uncharacterized protein n=1 Tax=marine sediment metagenome TaxID=412755 RepID=A0A0F9RTE3_9ZZZZ